MFTPLVDRMRWESRLGDYGIVLLTKCHSYPLMRGVEITWHVDEYNKIEIWLMSTQGEVDELAVGAHRHHTAIGPVETLFKYRHINWHEYEEEILLQLQLPPVGHAAHHQVNIHGDGDGGHNNDVPKQAIINHWLADELDEHDQPNNNIAPLPAEFARAIDGHRLADGLDEQPQMRNDQPIDDDAPPPEEDRDNAQADGLDD